jgi:hypothetical protein
MENKSLKSLKNLIHDKILGCPVCGAPLYPTDYGNHEVTLHCSSEQAKFWTHDRGSKQLMESKRHWDLSRNEVFLTVDDALKYVANFESIPTRNLQPGSSIPMSDTRKVQSRK